MKCQFCGAEFQPIRKTARFCSRSCSHNAWVDAHKEEWAQYNREWRETHPDYWREYYASGKGLEVNHRRHQKHPMERKARGAVAYAVRTGKMTKPNGCEVCGKDERLEAHHWHGYAHESWLDVKWLCHEHHLEAECKYA